MDFDTVISNRKSIRKFKTKKIPYKILKEIIADGIKAPSAGNRQPWDFVITDDEEIIRKLSVAAHNQPCVINSVAVITVVADPKRSGERYGTRGETLYCIQDTAASIQNILLSITNRGLGAVWVGAFEEEEVSEILSIPKENRPVAMVPLGYPDTDPEKRNRINLDEIVHKNRW
ncbi:MAG: nitroreductase family protein [Candidatus Ranarchaeia archaeon]